MVYLERPKQIPDNLTLNSKKPYKKPICPVNPYNIHISGDPRFIHHQILDEVHEKGPLPMGQLKNHFPEEAINRETRKGRIEIYEENGKTMVDLTDKGRKFRKFLNSPAFGRNPYS